MTISASDRIEQTQFTYFPCQPAVVNIKVVLGQRGLLVAILFFYSYYCFIVNESVQTVTLNSIDKDVSLTSNQTLYMLCHISLFPPKCCSNEEKKEKTPQKKHF